MGGRLPFRPVSPTCNKKDSRNTLYIVNTERGTNRLVQFLCTNRKTIRPITQTRSGQRSIGRSACGHSTGPTHYKVPLIAIPIDQLEFG